ncbi:MAG: hypothetical protein HQL51_15910 [Magnetococcales bacterium]|nr:hypothetical protein [Magnetococcales bacterium]
MTFQRFVRSFGRAAGCAACVLFAAAASAGPMQEIRLDDGSVLQGEVVSLQNGQYQIKTGTLGVVNLPQSRVRSIAAPGAAGSAKEAKANPALDQVMGQVSQQIQSDPELLKRIVRLADDPEIQKLLKDPELMRQIQEKDLQALENNPKMNQLMNHPGIKGVVKSTGR